jgi:hypothetical protein
MKIGIAIGILTICFAAYLAVGPFITMNSIRNAVESGDSEQLSEDIDFVSVRRNLREQFSAAMAAKATGELSDNPFALMALAFSDKLVEGMLDTFVTPSGIASLISGRNPLKKIDSDQTEIDDSEQQFADLWDKSSFGFDATDRFSIWVTNDEGDEVGLVMRRQGLKWRLTNILIPEMVD